MMVHDMDDETTMDEEELMADKEEFNEDELSELQKVSACKCLKSIFKKILIIFYYFMTDPFYQKCSVSMPSSQNTPCLVVKIIFKLPVGCGGEVVLTIACHASYLGLIPLGVACHSVLFTPFYSHCQSLSLFAVLFNNM